MIAVLFAASLMAQLPIDGLSAAPFGIAERAAEGVVSSGCRRDLQRGSRFAD
jgi:hypothetical protein